MTLPQKPRYVILEHDWPEPHFDLFFEMGSSLRSWRLFGTPGIDLEIPAQTNQDHRLIYLEFEGKLSGERGSVKRWDHGIFEIVEARANHLVVQLQGTRDFSHVEIHFDAFQKTTRATFK